MVTCSYALSNLILSSREGLKLENINKKLGCLEETGRLLTPQRPHSYCKAEYLNGYKASQINNAPPRAEQFAACQSCICMGQETILNEHQVDYTHRWTKSQLRPKI